MLRPQDVKTLLETTPESLAQVQYEGLKSLVLDRLRTLLAHLQAERFEDARGMLVYLPAGDECGLDGLSISFEDVLGKDAELGEAIGRLEQLHRLTLPQEPAKGRARK